MTAKNGLTASRTSPTSFARSCAAEGGFVRSLQLLGADATFGERVFACFAGWYASGRPTHVAMIRTSPATRVGL
jgi:hypothetical protein